MPAISTIKMRRGTAAAWAAANPVLAAGEPGLEIDTGVEKRGDGVTAWISLPVALAGTYVEGYVRGLVVNNASGSEVIANTVLVQAALDAAEAAVNSVDPNTVTALGATVRLPIGYIKVTGLSIASNVTLTGEGDKTILMLTGGSNTNLVQSKNWGHATAVDRGIVIRDMRLLGNKANQTISPVQSFVTAETAISQTPTTVPVLDTTGLASSGRAWIGYNQVSYTGKTATSLTGATIFSGTDTCRKGSWVTPTDSKGHLIAIQGTRCHVRVYGTDAAADGIHFQGPDPLASGGTYCPENVVHIGTRISSCEGYGLAVGQNAPDGMCEGTILGPDNLLGAMLVRSVDWLVTDLHPVGTAGTVLPIPQALIIAAGDFRAKGMYFDTWPGTLIVFDTAVQGWVNVNDCDLSQVRYFQCSWGTAGGGHGVLFRGIPSHGNVARARFAGVNMFSPVGYGYCNAPWTRTIGEQNFAAPVGGKVQVLNAMDFAPSSAVYGPLLSGDDSLEYTGRQINFTKLTASAAIGATSIAVQDTTGFDASGAATLAVESAIGSGSSITFTYTGKTGTSFTGIPASGEGSITAAVAASGERGAVAQHFFTGVTGGVTVSKADSASVFVNQLPLISEMQIADPIFRSYRVGRFNMSANDVWRVTGGMSGGKPMRSAGTLSIAAGSTTATTSHGINEAPTGKTLTPTSDTQGRRWWATATDADITVTVDAPAVTDPITFDWRAEVAS